MKILILGAAGYLGSKVVDRFREENHFVLQAPFRNMGEIPSRYSPIDVLINAAGIQGPVCLCEEIDVDKLNEVFEVNFTMPAQLMSAVLPSMKRNNFGRIINLSGGGAADSRPNYAAYAASKAALVRYSECVADECKGYNITVNCVAPGMMNSKLAGNITTEKESEANRDRAVDLIYDLTTPEYSHVTGRLIAAKWDNWREFSEEFIPPGRYKLRRTT